MIAYILLASLAGVLVGASRQINGRLSIATSPLIASFWNHIVGFGLLTVLGLIVGNLIPNGIEGIPWYSYAGGPIGVIFVAAGSWLIPRIGAVNTALLVIGGQMISGIALDIVSAIPRAVFPNMLGVALIIGGMTLTQRRRK